MANIPNEKHCRVLCTKCEITKSLTQQELCSAKQQLHTSMIEVAGGYRTVCNTSKNVVLFEIYKNQSKMRINESFQIDVNNSPYLIKITNISFNQNQKPNIIHLEQTFLHNTGKKLIPYGTRFVRITC